eukprot:6988307-Ditylum_brightwellii.AAC.1
MAKKIPLSITSSIGQRKGIQSRIIRNDAQRLWVKKRPIIVRHPQSNSIIERIHQTIGNMIRSFEVHTTDIDEKDPWTGILSAVRFAKRVTVHITIQANPMQLVFGRDTTLNVK